MLLLLMIPALSLAQEGGARRPRTWQIQFDRADEITRSFWAATGGEHVRFESTPMGSYLVRRATGGTPPTVLIFDTQASGGKPGRPGSDGAGAERFSNCRVTVDWISPLEFSSLGVLLNVSDDAASAICADWCYNHTKYRFILHQSTTPLTYSLPESGVVLDKTLSPHQPLAALRMVVEMRTAGTRKNVKVWMTNVSSGEEIGRFEQEVDDNLNGQPGQIGLRWGVLGGLIGAVNVEEL